MTKYLRVELVTLAAAFGSLHCAADVTPTSPPDPGGEEAPEMTTGTGDAPVVSAQPGAGAGPGGVPTSGAGTPSGPGDLPTTEDPTASPAETGDPEPAADPAEGLPVGAGTLNTAPGYVDLSPELGEPLPPQGEALTPPALEGWSWHGIDGAVCRDGSPAGIFVHQGAGEGLLWYLEGGGACTSPGFCNYNPANVDLALSGDGQTVIGSTLGPIPARQQPGVFEAGIVSGIFDTTNPENPFADWSMIYTPYCTGDVHFGTKADGQVPGVSEPQQFVGHLNMQKFVARVVPTFAGSIERVVLTGASAGSFGAALNASMVQDAFGDIPVDLILDSGVPFTDQYMPPCLQQYWRDLWGFDSSLPPDCEECFNADGGGLLGLADFMIEKHPNIRLAAVSSTQDEVIRLFFSAGLNSCATAQTADPVAITLGQLTPGVLMEGTAYESALAEVRDLYAPSGRLASYMIGGLTSNLHQHTWRTRFYEPAAGGVTIAQFIGGFLAGETVQVGP